MIELEIADGATVVFEPKHVVIAGYTGRDQAAVQHHIDELAAQGIAPPPRTPMFYEMPTDILTTAAAIAVPTAHTSGEVEPVLLVHAGVTYLGIGSDHTARDLEREDIARSKAACPKPVGKRVWRYDDVRAHLDAIAMRGYAHDGSRLPYQDGTLAAVMALDELRVALRARTGIEEDDLVLFCGTVPLLTGTFVYAPRFEFELVDPVRGDSLVLAYDCSVPVSTA